MKKVLSFLLLAFLLVGCLNSSSPGNDETKTKSDQAQGEVDLPENNAEKDDISENSVISNEIATKINLELIPLKNNEVLIKVDNIGNEDFSLLNIYLTFFEKDSGQTIERERYFYTLSAGNTAYDFTTTLKDYKVDLDKTKIRYSLGRPYSSEEYGDLRDFVTIDHGIDPKSGVYALAKNVGDQVISGLTVYVIFYANDEIIGAHMRFGTNLEPNEEVNFEFYYPLDADKKGMKFDDYLIGVNDAYYKKPWNCIIKTKKLGFQKFGYPK